MFSEDSIGLLIWSYPGLLQSWKKRITPICPEGFVSCVSLHADLGCDQHDDAAHYHTENWREKRGIWQKRREREDKERRRDMKKGREIGKKKERERGKGKKEKNKLLFYCIILYAVAAEPEKE